MSVELEQAPPPPRSLRLSNLRAQGGETACRVPRDSRRLVGNGLNLAGAFEQFFDAHSPLASALRTKSAAISRHVGFEGAHPFRSKYGSMIRRYAVCSGGSVPLGTGRCCDTALLNVS